MYNFSCFHMLVERVPRWRQEEKCLLKLPMGREERKKKKKSVYQVHGNENLSKYINST